MNPGQYCTYVNKTTVDEEFALEQNNLELRLVATRARDPPCARIRRSKWQSRDVDLSRVTRSDVSYSLGGVKYSAFLVDVLLDQIVFWHLHLPLVRQTCPPHCPPHKHLPWTSCPQELDFRNSHQAKATLASPTSATHPTTSCHDSAS